MTSNSILDFMKHLLLHDVSIHRNFNIKRFINEFAVKGSSENPVVPDFGCRRVYILKKYVKYHRILCFCSQDLQ